MADSIITVNDENFDAEIVDAELPCLLDFSAEWCGPCKKMVPLIEEVAREYEGRLRVGHVDVEESPSTAARYGVMSVPTIIFLQNGRVSNQITGSVSRQVLHDAVRKVIG